MIKIYNSSDLMISLRHENRVVAVAPKKSLLVTEAEYKQLLSQINIWKLEVSKEEPKPVIPDKPVVEESVKVILDEPVKSEPESVNYYNMYKAQLSKLCQDRNLDASGDKNTLISRLQAADNSVIESTDKIDEVEEV